MKPKRPSTLYIIILVCFFPVFIQPLSAAEIGDVNNDGMTDIVDALLTAQYYVGLDPAGFNPAYADVNCDSAIDIVDALLIAQYYVGLVSEFPCGTSVPAETPTPAVTSQPADTPAPEPTGVPGPDGQMKVQYRCGETSASTSQIKPQVNIINTGTTSIPLSEVIMRYYYTKEGSSAEEFSVDYAVIGSGNITGSPENGYLEVGFLSGAGSLSSGAGTGEIQLRLNKSDWSNYDQTDDYSFNSSKTAFEDWERITLFRNGSMIWGIDPDGNTPGPTMVPTPTPEPTPIPPPQVYYVDSTNGNDLNDGLTQSTAWEHCPGMPDWNGTAVLHAGDTVYFHSGRTWTASSGDALIQVTGGVTYDGRSWGSGTRAVLRATGDIERSIINVREDHPDVPTEIIGFDVDAGGYITSGIAINWPHSVQIIDGALKRIEDCIVHDVMSESNQNQYEYGIVISSGYGGNCTVANVEIINCVTCDISRGGINIYSANDDPNSNIRNVLVRGCEVYNSGLDSSYAGSQLNMKNHVINCTFEYNYVHDAVRGSGISFSTHPEDGFRGPENCVMRYNIVEGSQHAGILFNGRGAMSLEIYGNLIMNNLYSSFRILSGMDAVLSLKVYSNTFYKSRSENVDGWSPEISIDENSSVIQLFEFKNNILYSRASSPCMVDDMGSFTEHSNNIYYREEETNPQLMRVAGTYYSQTEVELFEPSGIHGNPLFKNPDTCPAGFTGTIGVDIRPASDGFDLLSGSPAIDNGTAIGSPYDLSINSILRPAGSGWDIGAYENE